MLTSEWTNEPKKRAEHREFRRLSSASTECSVVEHTDNKKLLDISACNNNRYRTPESHGVPLHRVSQRYATYRHSLAVVPETDHGGQLDLHTPSAVGELDGLTPRKLDKSRRTHVGLRRGGIQQRRATTHGVVHCGTCNHSHQKNPNEVYKASSSSTTTRSSSVAVATSGTDTHRATTTTKLQQRQPPPPAPTSRGNTLKQQQHHHAWPLRSNQSHHHHHQQLQQQSVDDTTIVNIIVEAVRALYRDELRPTLPELRRRLLEFQVPSAVIKDLASYCSRFSGVLRMNSTTQEVFLVAEPQGFKGFVDPKDPNDTFDCCTWTDFNNYVTCLVQHTDGPSTRDVDGLLDYQFQGGRYGMAVKMRKDPRLQSHRLKEMSMGRLCHLIQLSIAYGIMQYENNILQPRATCLRIGAAFAQSDLESNLQGNATNLEVLKDAETVKTALKEVLKHYPNAMLLSQLKFAFENSLSSRLCQSVFGCTRLSNLLQLPVFQSICRILGDQYSRVLVQSVDYPIPPGMHILSHEDRFSGSMTDDKARRTVSIPFSTISRPCCTPYPHQITFLHWRLSSREGSATDTLCSHEKKPQSVQLGASHKTSPPCYEYEMMNDLPDMLFSIVRYLEDEV